ncbi:MAG: UbiA-like protein EboC [Bacteroidota bacterium]
MNKLLGYLRLMRPANVVTSVADVVAGIAISGYFLSFGLNAQLLPAILLCIATIGLYSGGIIYNDVFDAELDKVERPERPISSGLVSEQGAAIFGGVLFVIGIFAAGMYSPASQYLAAGIMIACLVYNKFLKHNAILGPVNMGLCRGLNLLLGVSILPSTLHTWWYLAIVPIIYIAAITMISRGEVHGGSKKTLYFAAALYAVVIAALLTFAAINGQLPLTTVFVIPFLLMIFLPLIKAIQNPIGPNIGKAVKSGVIALILMNAAWASAFGAWHLAVFIVILLPISLLLSKAFAVT